MGIDGLLNLLKPVTQKQHISSFKNQRVGVDVMSWIYKGCYSCNFQLVQNITSYKYLYYLLEMIELLSYYNIKPIFVFDGRSFNPKNETNLKRIKQKEQNKAKGQKYLAEGNYELARKYFSRCIFIGENIISTTINALHTKGIEFIIAPYQADSQLAKLKKQNLIDVAIGQDSDLIVYGVNTILKLNQSGDCDYVDLTKWSPKDVDNKFLKQYLAMGMMNRIQVAVLAGCDYNVSIKGIGIKRAVKNVYRQNSLANVINKLSQQKTYSDRIPSNYLQMAQKSSLVFLFATVYNPISNKLEFLSPQLIDQHKPQQMSQSQLSKIVGQNYSQFIDRQVYNGKCNAKDLTARDVNKINMRQMFEISKEKLIASQTMNKKRRFDEQKARKQRQQAISIGQMNVNVDDENEVNKYELTEQEKQRNKQVRKKKIMKLQDAMDMFMKMKDQSDGQQEEEKGQERQNYFEDKDRKLLKCEQWQNSSESENNKSEDDDEQVMTVKKKEEEVIDLEFVNPFAKKSQQKNLLQSFKKEKN